MFLKYQCKNNNFIFYHEKQYLIFIDINNQSEKIQRREKNIPIFRFGQ